MSYFYLLCYCLYVLFLSLYTKAVNIKFKKYTCVTIFKAWKEDNFMRQIGVFINVYE